MNIHLAKSNQEISQEINFFRNKRFWKRFFELLLGW